MDESKIAVRYSRALFMSAVEKGFVKEVREDMNYILELAALEDFRAVIDSPVIDNRKKKGIMTALLKDKLNNISFSLVLLAVENNRESYLPGIARCFIDAADKSDGITKVKLITADDVSVENKKKVIELIEKSLNTKLDLHEESDKEIGGGFILKIEDLYVDASVKSNLRKIKKELLKEI